MFHNHKSLGCAAILLLLLFGVSIAQGQEVARSFEQLRSRVSVGDKVTVTDVKGRELHGPIAELSSSSLALVVGKSQTRFFEADVETVSRRDARWNGTLWGLGVGGVLGAAVAAPLVQVYHRLDDATYRYASAGGQFVTELRVNPGGFVIQYPNFWHLEADSGGSQPHARS